MKNIGEAGGILKKRRDAYFYVQGSSLLDLPSLKPTASSPLKIGRAPKGKDRLPTSIFGSHVSFRECNECIFPISRNLFPPKNSGFYIPSLWGVCTDPIK